MSSKKEIFKNHEYSYRTWVEISRRALRSNLRELKKFIGPETKILGVVKSNAYGHELHGFTRELTELGVDFIGVDSISEGHSVRAIDRKVPILVMGHTLPENMAIAARENMSVAISQFENLRYALAHAGEFKRKLKVHLKIDTGFHRQGFSPAEVPKAVSMLRGCKSIIVEGIFTHFAAAKDPAEPHDTDVQIERFEQALASVRAAFPNVLTHAAATGGAINYPHAKYDMVRMGIAMYGMWPSEETRRRFEKEIKLEPVLSWYSTIGEVKTVPAGESVGYNFTAKLTRDTKLAIVPIGYWHGYPRSLSNRAKVLVNGHPAPVIGTVSMDMVTVDVTDVPGRVRVGDKVTLIGTSRDKKYSVTADELGDLAGTINYEIVTRLNPLIKRNFV